jgi:dihydrolipoamide dehydrogenase
VELVVAPVSDESKHETLRGDKVLIAIGVQGNIEGVLDPSLGVAIHKGHINVDKRTYATNVAGLYAVGDVIGPPWLAHVASEEAVTCVERIAGAHAHDVDYDSVPGCTYCQPQVASMGRTEQALKVEGLKAGSDYNVGKFPFQASGKAQALGNTEGFVKILTDAKYGEILGVHMVGENVTELLAELGLAKRLEATHDEIIATMHAHPTLSEAIHEATLGTQGRTLNF